MRSTHFRTFNSSQASRICEKQATLPSDWLAGPHFPTDEKREHYLEQNDLHGLPLALDRFLDFHAARRELMAGRLRLLLGATPTIDSSDPAVSCAGGRH